MREFEIDVLLYFSPKYFHHTSIGCSSQILFWLTVHLIEASQDILNFCFCPLVKLLRHLFAKLYLSESALYCRWVWCCKIFYYIAVTKSKWCIKINMDQEISGWWYSIWFWFVQWRAVHNGCIYSICN